MSALKVPTKSDLLAAIEALPFRERWEILRPLLRAFDENPAVQSLTHELASSPDFTCRLLAASIAGGSRGLYNNSRVGNGSKVSSPETAALLLHLVKDPDDRIAARVISGALSNMSPEMLADLIPSLPPSRLSYCCLKLHQMGRGADVDKIYRLLVPLQPAGGDGGCGASPSKRISVAQQQRILSFVSLAVWDSLPRRAVWLGPIAGSNLVTNARCWLNVCERFPEWAANRIAEEVKDLGAHRVQLPQPLERQTLTTLKALARLTTSTSFLNSAVALLRVALDKMLIDDSVLKGYTKRAPKEVLGMMIEKGLLRENSLWLSGRVWSRIEKEAPEMIETLAKGNYIRRVRMPSTLPEELPATLRQAIFSLNRQRFVGQNGVILAPVLFAGAKGLANRAEEAEKYFMLKSLESDPYSRVSYLSLLPFPRAMDLATAASFITNSDVNIRIEVVRNLVKATLLYPEHITDVLHYALKRSKEQDPWRAALFESLSHVPTNRWRPDEHFPLLEELLTAAIAAKDLSSGTMSCIVQLLFKISLSQSTFAVKHLTFWVEKCDGYVGYRLYKHVVQKTNANALWGCMEQYARRGIQTNSFHAVETLFDLFADLIRFLGDGPKSLLLDTLNMASVQGFITAIPYLLKHYRLLTITEVIPNTLEKHPDCVLDDTVREVLSRDIQGPHLRSVITGYSYGMRQFTKGKFANYYVKTASQQGPLEFKGILRYRWPSSLQQAYGESILSYLEKEETQPVYTCRTYFQYLRELPGFCPGENSLLLQFARLEGPENEAKRDFALHTLGHMHDAETMRELTAAMKDEKRVRTAFIAKKRRLRTMGPDEALAQVQEISGCKLVTVQKELARMVGFLGTPKALAFLNEWGACPDLHTHVRLAILKGSFNFLDDAKVWDRLIEAAGPDSKPDTAVELCSTPDTQLLYPWQMAKYRSLLLTLLKHPHAHVSRTALSKVQSAWALSDDMAIFDALVPFLEDADPNSPFQSYAASALLRMAVHPDLLVDKIVSLPSAYSLSSFIEMLASYCRRASHLAERRHLTSLCSLVVEKLTAKRRQVALCPQLVLLCAPSFWGTWIELWERSGLLHHGVAVALMESAANISLERFELAEWSEAELSMRTSASSVVRRVGLAVLVRLGKRSGWDVDTRLALQSYQNDPDAWVSESALIVSLPPLLC